MKYLFIFIFFIHFSSCIYCQTSSTKHNATSQKTDTSTKTEDKPTIKASRKGQSTDGETDHTTSIVRINIVNNTAFQQIQVDEKTKQFILSNVPDTLIIAFPSPFDSYSIQFNKDSTKQFKLDFSTFKDSKNSIYVDERWLTNGELKLVFQKNDLIGIIGRPNPITGKTLDLDKSNQVTIKIIDNSRHSKSVGTMYDSLDTRASQKDFAAERNKINDYKYFCPRVKCKSCDPSDTGYIVRQHVKDLYQQIFEKENFFYDPLNGKNISAKYWVVLDYRTGKGPVATFLKYSNPKKGGPDWSIVQKISPMVRKQIVYTIIGAADSTYILDSTEVQNYLDQEAQSASVIEGISPSGSAAVQPTPPVNAVVATNETNKITNTSALNNIQGMTYEKKVNTLNEFYRQNSLLNFALTDSDIKTLSKGSKDTVQLGKLLDEFARSLIQIHDLQEVRDSLSRKVDSQQLRLNVLTSISDKQKQQIAEMNRQVTVLNQKINVYAFRVDSLTAIVHAIPQTIDLKEKLLALDRDLETFNGQYDDISFVSDEYKYDLLCLQLKIKDILQIPVDRNSQDLAQSLINLVLINVKDSGYYKQFSNLIKAIESAYQDALTKTPVYKISSVSKQVPNVDEFDTRIRTSKTTTYSYQEPLYTSWGLKIDFSTGIFINGIASPAYILGGHSFQYAERKDTFDVAGNLHPVYTGKILDTTGNLIQINQPKNSYSAGFLAHVYPRTGGFVNIGGVAGITISNSNSSPLVLMAGISCMFGVGSTRISIVGGCSWGQVKMISSVAEPYIWNQSKDPDNTLYKSVNDVPRFYVGSSDIPTYDTWKHSWFFGLTYNFATVTTGKNN